MSWNFEYPTCLEKMKCLNSSTQSCNHFLIKKRPVAMIYVINIFMNVVAAVASEIKTSFYLHKTSTNSKYPFTEERIACTYVGIP